ncbi:metallopeptidase TldD-related protein [Streptomyces sp. NPDC057623]|uniref:metallopeptidase TldD-related protein n=1 Tax=Streptomyces sp. NPDC057623 TaxID=3346187 RepID=UPI003686266C
MRRLHSRTDEALAFADAVERGLRPEERSFTYISRTGRRGLGIDPSGAARLTVQNGKLGGYVLLSRDRHELYVHTPDMAAGEAARVLTAGRAQISLGRPRGAAASGASRRETPVVDGDWHNVEESDELEPLAAGPGPLLERLTDGMGPRCALRAVNVTEVLSESVCAASEGTRAVSRCRGVELHATAADADGAVGASLSRYAATLDRVDAAGLGRELALTVKALSPPTKDFDGPEVRFTPSAAAQLLRAVVAGLLLNPMVDCPPLGVALVDDGRAEDGPAAHAFDCEGTPTGAMELVTGQGAQQGIATRLTSVAGTDGAPVDRLTGHARWDPVRNLPLPAATNVRLVPADRLEAPWSGERCVVADVRSLGVEEHRSSGKLAFRLLAVRAVDGVPAHAYTPMVVEGEAAAFLAAITGAGETVSYHPGPFAVGGADLVMDLSRLRSKSEA